MQINMDIRNNERIIYDIVTDGATYRVRYHKDTRNWSGKWYWLKDAVLNDKPAIREFPSYAEANAGVFADADRRRAEVDMWTSAEPHDTIDDETEEIRDEDNPF